MNFNLTNFYASTHIDWDSVSETDELKSIVQAIFNCLERDVQKNVAYNLSSDITKTLTIFRDEDGTVRRCIRHADKTGKGTEFIDVPYISGDTP